MKRTLPVIVPAVLLAACAARPVRAQNADFKGFPDVPKDHWAAQAVNDLARRGILQGYPAEQSEQSGGKLKPKPVSQTPPAAKPKQAAGKTPRRAYNLPRCPARDARAAEP